MTTTSDEIELRDPYANAYDPAAERAEARASTFGAPRRSRERRSLLAGLAVVLVPLLALVGLGVAVIRGYDNAVAARATAARPAERAAVSATPAGPDAELADHAPTGADVGTDGLTPSLARAVTRAREAATKDGITIDIVSGRRSATTQQQLFDHAVAKYGSAQAAAQWVLPPEKSAHVPGKAIDVGPYAAANWLEKHGVRYGLCRRYANEYWHFELLAPAKGQACPPVEANAASGG